MIYNQPITQTITNVPRGYIFPNGMSRAHQLTIVWHPSPDYEKDGRPAVVGYEGGCLLETALEAIVMRMQVLLHPQYIAGVSSPEKMKEAVELIHKAMDTLKQSWTPPPHQQVEDEPKQESRQESRQGARRVTK